jgi:hypothetical protein
VPNGRDDAAVGARLRQRDHLEPDVVE